MEYTMAAFMFDLNCTPPLLDLNCTPPVSCTPPTGGYAPDQDAGRTHWLSLPLVLQFLSKAPKKFKQNHCYSCLASYKSFYCQASSCLNHELAFAFFVKHFLFKATQISDILSAGFLFLLLE
jgi:hypothetical protein